MAWCITDGPAGQSDAWRVVFAWTTFIIPDGMAALPGGAGRSRADPGPCRRRSELFEFKLAVLLLIFV